MRKKIFYGIGILLLAVNAWFFITGKTFIYKALVYNFVEIDDYILFDNNTIEKSSKPQPWSRTQLNEKELTPRLDSVLNTLNSVAFAVVKNKELLQEHYWDGYSTDSKSNTFSAAKSHVSALIGIAYKEGLIKSLEEPVANYVSSFNEGDKKKIRILDVLKMSSGLNWEESYAGPLSMTTEAYYGKDLEGLINKLQVADVPGKEFKYLSGDTEVLAMVLKNVTGKSLSEYAQEKLWEPLGYEKDALWSLDKEGGIEKAYCCINSNATDLARIGRLYNHLGNWNGHQIINPRFVQASTRPAQYANGPCDHYGYMWWVYDKMPGKHIFYARGILGQYIICIPSEDLVIVRLGHNRGEKKDGTHPEEVGIFIEEVLKMYGK